VNTAVEREPPTAATATGHTLVTTVVALSAFAANSLLCRAALAGGHIDAANFTTIRIASGALTLAVLARTRGRAAPSSSFAWGSAAALFAYAILFSFAYVHVAVGVGALLAFGAVQITMIGAGLRAGERLRVAEWTGLAISIAGLVVLTQPGLERPDGIGSLLMLGAGAAWGIFSLRGRRGGDPIAVNAASFARAIPMTIVVTLVTWFADRSYISTSGILLAVCSGGITSGIGYAVWYAALKGLSATRAAIVQLCVPPLAATAGVIVLGEDFSSRLVIASALVLGGIALAITAPRRG